MKIIRCKVYTSQFYPNERSITISGYFYETEIVIGVHVIYDGIILIFLIVLCFFIYTNYGVFLILESALEYEYFWSFVNFL